MVAGYLLLPDSIVLHFNNCCTARKRWEMVSKEDLARSAYAQADLHQSFLEMCCTKGEDVREFLARLCCKREELAAAGVQVTCNRNRDAGHQSRGPVLTRNHHRSTYHH